MTGPDYSKLIYLVIMGGIIAAIAFFSVRNLLALMRLRSGTRCAGTVSGKRIDRDEGTFHYVTYGFKDSHGRAYEREVQAPENVFAGLAEGRRIDIVYQPTDPDNSYPADARSIRSYFLTMVFLLLFAALLSYVVYSFVIDCVILDACPAEE